MEKSVFLEAVVPSPVSKQFLQQRPQQVIKTLWLWNQRFNQGKLNSSLVNSVCKMEKVHQNVYP